VSFFVSVSPSSSQRKEILVVGSQTHQNDSHPFSIGRVPKREHGKASAPLLPSLPLGSSPLRSTRLTKGLQADSEQIRSQDPREDRCHREEGLSRRGNSRGEEREGHQSGGWR